MTEENKDFMQELDAENREIMEDYLENIRRKAYRYYEEVIVTEVDDTCPYGHKKGDSFRLTNMNSDSMCGSLYQPIHTNLTTLHYGGTMLWGDPESFTGTCMEGRVQVKLKRVKLPKPTVVRTENTTVDMTGKGYPGVDKYRIYLETISVANNCTWGHCEGQKVELDPFNIGKVCGFLYWELYQYMNLLLSGGHAPWEADPDIIHGCCPDPFNQVTYRLIREKR